MNTPFKKGTKFIVTMNTCNLKLTYKSYNLMRKNLKHFSKVNDYTHFFMDEKDGFIFGAKAWNATKEIKFNILKVA